MSAKQGHNSFQKIVPFIIQTSKLYFVYTSHFHFGISNLQPFLENLFLISLFVRLFQSCYSFSITFEIHSFSVMSHNLFFAECYIFKFFKILFWVDCNCANVRIVNIFYFMKSHLLSHVFVEYFKLRPEWVRNI